MSARRGGLYVGGFAIEEGIDVLLWALELYPGARVEIVTAGTTAADLRGRMQCCAYLVVPGLSYDAEPRALVMAFAEAFPEKMRQMGECAQADYQARFVADWNWRRLYGERRRQARLHP